MRKQKQKSCFEIIKVGRSGTCCYKLTEFDGDVTFQFVLEANSVDAGDGFHHCRLSVSYMTDSSDVYCCLS